MEKLLGLVRIRVLRGIELAARDTMTSDPYVVIRMDTQVDFKSRICREIRSSKSGWIAETED